MVYENVCLELFRLLKGMSFAFIISIGFAVLFNTPKKVLIVVGLLGDFGYCMKYILYQYLEQGLIFSTLSSCLSIGLLGIYFAHKVHTPPIIFTIPACVTMIPGLYAYRSMLSLIRIADTDTYKNTSNLLLEMLHNSILAVSLLFCLAIGLSAAILLFRKQSVKTLSFPKKRK